MVSRGKKGSKKLTRMLTPVQLVKEDRQINPRIVVVDCTTVLTCYTRWMVMNPLLVPKLYSVRVGLTIPKRVARNFMNYFWSIAVPCIFQDNLKRKAV
jgi:hypothetical protein